MEKIDGVIDIETDVNGRLCTFKVTKPDVDYKSQLEKYAKTNSDLADFEMKPEVLEATAEYSGWKNYQDLVGPHVSQVYLEIEASLF